MSKKPQKVGEATASYAGKKPVAGSVPVPQSGPAVRYASPEQVRKASGQVFKVHEKLFRKLAQ